MINALHQTLTQALMAQQGLRTIDLFPMLKKLQGYMGRAILNLCHRALCRVSDAPIWKCSAKDMSRKVCDLKTSATNRCSKMYDLQCVETSVTPSYFHCWFDKSRMTTLQYLAMASKPLGSQLNGAKLMASLQFQP